MKSRNLVFSLFFMFASSCVEENKNSNSDAATQPTYVDAQMPSKDAVVIIDAAQVETDAGMVMNEDAQNILDAQTPSLGPILTDSHQALFFGNSYTAQNSLPGLYRSFIDTAALGRAPIRIESVTAGGRLLTQHAAEIDQLGTSTNRWLSGSDQETDWDLLVLQEQSQIPGFNDSTDEKQRSVLAAVRFAEKANELGAVSVLFMTWGRRNGDPRNLHIYPDFLTMQDRLEAGYRQMKNQIELDGYRAVIAPIGLAFKEIHNEEILAGRDPLDPNGSFYTLYSSDGSHPSLEGSYLAACVLWATSTQELAKPIKFVPSGISSKRAEYLRQIADRVVAAEN